MSAMSLIVALFVGVMFGVVITALMVMAKDRKPENEGAALFAFTVLDRIADWKVESSGGNPAFLVPSLIQMCEEAIKRAEMHEEKFPPDSTNG